MFHMPHAMLGTLCSLDTACTQKHRHMLGSPKYLNMTYMVATLVLALLACNTRVTIVCDRFIKTISTYCHELLGFEGKNCEVDINECESNPCKNNGTCVDEINDYKCTCKAGFVGKSCEVN